MEEKILQLLEGLKSEMGNLNAKVDNIESEMGDLRSDVGSLKLEMGDLKSDVGSLRSEMHSRFDRVDHLLVGIGGQFEHQTSQRIAEGQAVSKELMSIKSRIFDLESKTM
jgi:chromosome segregation ATPase